MRTAYDGCIDILRAARAPPEYIQASRHFRCDACENNKPKHQSTKVALPKDYVFSRNLGIDVLEVKDIVLEHSRLRYYFSTSSTAATGTQFAV